MEKSLDVFISYEHESKSIADNIVSVLEQHKVRCWYAPRDVIGDYATSIVEAIERCRIFVIVLNERSSNSPHCLNEVEQAFKANINQEAITIIPFKVDNKDLSKAMDYYVKRQHWIDACSRTLDVAIFDLKEKIIKILGIAEKKEVVRERIDNKYDSASDFEKTRLNNQQKVLKKFDIDIYNRLIEGKKNVSVLDVGSGDGSLIVDRFGHCEAVDTIIGIETNAENVIFANDNYSNEKINFFALDLTSSDFEIKLKKIMNAHNIENFDIIHCSMIFLHIRNNYHLLKKLRKFLSNEGCIYIKDIDDGLNFAYPDINHDFERVYEICRNNVISGYRYSGREIATNLILSGFKNIEILKNGYNTINMSFEDKQSFFDIYFSFIKDDLRIQCERYPDDEYYRKEYAWLCDIYEDLERKFMNHDFVFNLGLMSFIGFKN